MKLASLAVLSACLTLLSAASALSQSGSTTVEGAIPVSANATDNVGVVGVQFYLDGSPLGSEDTNPPYSITWDTTSVPNGSYTLTATARDAAGNVGTSPPVRVDVFNPDTEAPSVIITSP